MSGNGSASVGRTAVIPQRHVPARKHKLELALPWLAEDGDALRVSEAALVVLQLPIEAGLPVGLDQTLELTALSAPSQLPVESYVHHPS